MGKEIPAKRREDKIFNNKYNTGDIEFKHFGTFAIDTNWLTDQNRGFFDDQENFENLMLQENLFKIFEESSFYEKYSKNKKVKKDEVLKIFYYFLDRLEEPERYTAVEKFIEIASFMNINFKTLYNSLNTVFKEDILKELNRKYDIFKQKKIHRLF